MAMWGTPQTVAESGGKGGMLIREPRRTERLITTLGTCFEPMRAKLIILAAVGVAVSGGAIMFLSRTRTYEECIAKESKTPQSSMYEVSLLCRRRHPQNG